jgi:lathosterol oxidase
MQNVTNKMDIILQAADSLILNDIYHEFSFVSGVVLLENDIIRQCVSLWAIAALGATVLYFTLATASFYILYDHENMKHPKFLKNQIRREIGVCENSFQK